MLLLSSHKLKMFLLFLIFVNCFSSNFADYCLWCGPSILHVTWFTLDPSQSRHCQKNLSHFHLQRSFSHHFQFLKLLFLFGVHRNHMSFLSSIFNALTHCYLLIMMIAMFIKYFQSKHKHGKTALTNQVTTIVTVCWWQEELKCFWGGAGSVNFICK